LARARRTGIGTILIWGWSLNDVTTVPGQVVAILGPNGAGKSARACPSSGASSGAAGSSTSDAASPRSSSGSAPGAYAERPIGEVSGGEQQRLLIA
jgi:ABC-type Mn2+/Zn2+ transport system ATPase subunit